MNREFYILFVFFSCYKMKIVLLIGIFLACSLTYTSANDVMKQATYLVMVGCKNAAGATDEDMKILQDRKLPTNHAGLCMLECLLTRGNMMKDGKFNKQGFITSSTRSMKGNPENIQKLKDMADVCEKEIDKTGGDNCDTARNIVRCTSDKGKSFGFVFPSNL